MEPMDVDMVWHAQIAEVYRKSYPGWLRWAEYFRWRLHLREEAHDIVAQAVEHTIVVSHPAVERFSSFVYAKIKSDALNLIRRSKRLCGISWEPAAPGEDEIVEFESTGWARMREQTAKLRSDSFVSIEMLTQPKTQTCKVVLRSTSHCRMEGVRIQPMFFVTTSDPSGTQTHLFYNKQKAVTEFYKYL